MERHLQVAATRFPDKADVFNNLGVALKQQGKLDAAQTAYRRAIELAPGNGDTWNNLGNALKLAGDLAAAVDAYRKAIALRPAHADAHFNLGTALAEQERIAEAADCFRQSAALRPNHYDSLVNLGVASKQLKRHDAAVDAYRRAIAVEPDNPSAWIKLGNALEAADRFTDAIETYRQAIARAPDSADAHNGLGLALMHAGDPAAGIAPMRRAIALDPVHAWAHTNLGLALLTLGDFAEGWREYEWRWELDDFADMRRVRADRLWDGGDIAGRTVFLTHEQGMGDSIQFLRYATELAGRGARVIVGVQPPLRRVAARVPGVSRAVSKGDPGVPFDVHCSMMSAPLLCGTTLATIPAVIPYITAEPELEAAWAERLPEGPRRIGLCWAGKPSFRSDARRSVPLAAFAPFAQLQGVRWISLQKGPAADQSRTPPAGLALEDWTTELADFADTVALIARLDLVVTVDTAVAHLAGAMGKPVWMLCRSDSEWRWMLGRDDSPWYPTLRLYRQSRAGDWSGPIGRMCDDIARQPGVTRVALPTVAPGATPAARLDIWSRSRAALPAATRGYHGLARTRHGLLLYNRNDQYVGRSVAVYGEYSEGEIDLFRQLVRAGDTVLEAGANIGAHTIWFAGAVGPAGRVLAYEPQRLVFQTLCANLALNDLANVHAAHAALGRASGRIRVPEPDPARVTNFGGLSIGGESDSGEAPVETVDGLALTALRLLKADVEGMESEVIAGAADTIRRLRPVLYVENDRRAKSAALIAQIRGMGYRLWWHTPPLFNPANHAGETKDVFGRIVSINLLCLPVGQPANVTLREVRSDDDWWR
jgi:FkbM family methyltransferase